MRIDPDVEPLVREALARSVSRDEDRFEDAVLALLETEDQARRSLSLTLAVAHGTLLVVHNGPPDAAQIQSLAAEFAQTEPWSQVSEAQAREILTFLAAGRSPLETMEPGPVLLATLAIGGWLLSAFKVGRGLRWNELLDFVLDQLEALPD